MSALKFDDGKAEAMYFYFSGVGKNIQNYKEYPTGTNIISNVYIMYEELVEHLNNHEKAIDFIKIQGKLKSMQNYIVWYLRQDEKYLLPMSEVIKGICTVSKLGAQKYGMYNYKKGMEWSRVVNALGRHLLSYAYGEIEDPESNVNHLFHALANIHMLQYMVGCSAGKNDFLYRKEVSNEKNPE